MGYLFDVFLLALAVYVIYSAISGKGRLFDTTYIKDGKEDDFIKSTRIIYAVLGFFMILNSAISFVQDIFYTVDSETGSYVLSKDLGALSFLTPKVISVLNIVFLAVILVLVVVLVIVSNKFTDKSKRPSGNGKTSSSSKQAGHTLPVDAFEFEEEDKK